MDRLARTAVSLRVMIHPDNPLRPAEPEAVAAYYEGWITALVQRIEQETKTNYVIVADTVIEAQHAVLGADDDAPLGGFL